jgi:hypothetical protein
MKRVRIKDHADADGTVRNHTFQDCEVIGPAALVAVGADNEIEECEYPWSVESLAQTRAGPSTKDILFVIGCTFRHCRFAIDVDVTRLQPTQTRSDEAPV